MSPRCSRKLITALRREGADSQSQGRPWSLHLENRVLLVTMYWRTNLTLRQPAPLFGISKSAAAHIIDHLGPWLALDSANGSARTRCSSWTAPLVVVVGPPLPGNRNDCKAWEESGAKAAVGNTVAIADGGCPGASLVIPHRRKPGRTELPRWKEEHNRSHKQGRARGEHTCTPMKGWKILRDCRLKGEGVHNAMHGIARLHNLCLTGRASKPQRSAAVPSDSQIIAGRPSGRARPVRVRQRCRSHAGGCNGGVGP